MKIKSNAATAELESPFYYANREFCLEFERYVDRKNGEVKGSFNAWSYLIYGWLNSPNRCKLRYQKSTFTSTGHLLLSSKKQTLQTYVKWELEGYGEPFAQFKIRERRWADYFKRLFNSPIRSLDQFPDYVLLDGSGSESDILLLKKILKKLFLSGEIYQIELKNRLLEIELRSKFHHFDTLNELLIKLKS